MTAPMRADREFLEKALVPLRWLRRYHRYRIEGLEHIPGEGAALLVFSHSLATYDIMLLADVCWRKVGRVPTGLGDNLIFKTPILKDWALRGGMVPASPTSAREVLEDGHLVMVAPGGMRESLRPSTEKYHVRWDKRRGFVKLAIEMGVPLILCACPAADDLYTVYESNLTKVAYKNLKVPIPVMRGLGLTALPRPVKLTHYIGAPIVPPAKDEATFDQQVEDLHARVISEMDELMARGH